jgi:hypothetical protein
MYEDGDEVGIVKLFKEIFGREMTIEEWRWKYKQSYPHKNYSSVAVHKDMGIIGHYGGMCFPLIYKGRPARGLAICDVMIHPRFRGIKTLRELSYLVPYEAVKDGLIIGYGFPNKDTLLKPALRLGIYEMVEDVLEGNKEVKLHNDLTRYRYKLFPLDYSDTGIDRLWESCKNNFPLSVVRDRRYLTWRYKNHPHFTYEIWGFKKRAGRSYHGLTVLRKEGNRAFLMDFLYTEGMFDALIKKLENYLYTSGIRTLILWTPPFMEKSLVELGFSTQRAITSIPRTTHEKTLTKEQIAGQFFYTMGDTDLQ